MSDDPRRIDGLGEVVLRRVLDSIEEAVFLIGPPHRGIVQACNAAVERIFGYAPQELEGRDSSVLHVDRESWERFGRIGERALDEAGRFETGWRMRCKDGRVIDTVNVIAPLDPERGWRAGVVSTVRDVTAQKRLLRDLGERVKELHCIAEVGRLAADDALEVDELLWRAVRLLPPAVLEPERAVARIRLGERTYDTGAYDACATDLSSGFEVASGESGSVGFGYPEPLPEGEDGAFLPEERKLLEIVADRLSRAIDHRLALADLRDREASYRLLAEQTLDVIWVVDPDLNVTYVNPAVEAQLGHPPEDFVGTRLEDHCPPEEYRRLVGIIRDLVAQGPRRRGTVVEVDLLRADGSRIPVEIHGKVVFDDDGRVRSLQGTSRDLTERRSLEHQLRTAQKMESVGRLAGGVAHDFNNILTVILGNADIVSETLGPEHAAASAVDEITRAAERASSLTRQLLGFARRQPAAPRPLDLNEAVAGTLKMLRRLIGEEIDLVWQPGRRPGVVRIDPGQLDQILANLAVNARDAIAGPGTLRIAVERRTVDAGEAERRPGLETGEHVVLTVSDDGCGMDPSLRARVFEPFFTTKRAGHGTGLGLATVYGIVKQNRGYVDVESEPGEGTTFRVYLPWTAEEASDEAPRPPATTLPGGSETVLLVEDEPAVRDLVRSMIERLGYRVRVAAGPSEAIRTFEGDPDSFDLLMTDVVMPDMTGKDLCDRLERVRPGVRCLFMSGYPATEVADRGILEEGTPFLQKPFTASDLAETLRRVLAG